MVLVPVHRVCGFPLFFSTAISSGIFTRNFTSACSLTPFSIKIHVNDSVPRCEHEMIPLTPVYVLSVVITLCIHYGWVSRAKVFMGEKVYDSMVFRPPTHHTPHHQHNHCVIATAYWSDCDKSRRRSGKKAPFVDATTMPSAIPFIRNTPWYPSFLCILNNYYYYARLFWLRHSRRNADRNTNGNQWWGTKNMECS